MDIDIHASSGIRTHNPSVWAAKTARLLWSAYGQTRHKNWLVENEMSAIHPPVLLFSLFRWLHRSSTCFIGWCNKRAECIQRRNSRWAVDIAWWTAPYLVLVNHYWNHHVKGGMRWLGHVAHVEETRKAYNILFGKFEEKRPLWRTTRIHRSIILWHAA
jgi:hypothetical protein